MTGDRRGGAVVWRVVAGIAVIALVGAIVHLHGKIASLERRMDGLDRAGDRRGGGGEEIGASEGRPGPDRDGKALRAARLEALLSSAARAASRDPDRGRPSEDRGGNGFVPHAAFLEAMRRDGSKYSFEENNRIERLYRHGNERFETEKGREDLRELVKTFPGSNRADCAASNLGAYYLEEGELDSAAAYYGGIIDSGSVAVFDNGEKVLPKALYNYGRVLERQGDGEGAAAAWRRLTEEFADDLDAEGTPYGDLASRKL